MPSHARKRYKYNSLSLTCTPGYQAAQAMQSSPPNPPPTAPPRPRAVRPPRTGPCLAHTTQSRARLCCSCRPIRARDTSTTAFPLRALEVAFGRVFALRTLKYKPVHGLQLFQVAIQVQRPFPYVHSRLPLREFSHFAP